MTRDDLKSDPRDLHILEIPRDLDAKHTGWRAACGRDPDAK